MPLMPSPPETPRGVTLRDTVRAQDRDTVRRIVDGTGFFRPDEVDVAVELIDTCLERGELAGYHFIFAEHDTSVLGYACYGPIACTIGSYDLYWIAVDTSQQSRGIGRTMLLEVERRIQQRGGRQIYIETSGRPQYAPTRAFYERCGYRLAAVLADFYDHGDDKVIWTKDCATASHSSG